MLLLLFGCAEAGGSVVLHGAEVVGVGTTDVVVDGGAIAGLGVGDGEVVDVTGRFITGAFVDSHVHLAYRDGEAAMAAGGVAAAVDLASPIEFLAAAHSLRILFAGPMVTDADGYPLDSWGGDGYGLGVEGATEAAAAVDRLHAAGARVLKLPITDDLDRDELVAAADRAHALGMKVAVHALRDSEAALAAEIGADVLAHTPVQALSASTVQAWAGKAVITTLRAFGASAAALSNLAALRAAGTTVLYGTDFGNTSTPGIDGRELAAMASAGMDGAAILAAGTTSPATYWGLDGLGTVAVGAPASLLVLDADPRLDPTTLGRPVQVWVDGVRRR